MGLFSGIRAPFTGGKKGWNPFDLKGQFGGKIDPFSASLIGGWAEKGDPDRTAYNSQEDRRRSEEMTPGPNNPAIRRWSDAASSSVRSAGGSEAAAASAGKRAGLRGTMGLSRLAPEYWQRLMNLAQGVAGDMAGIKTTTSQNAFFQGFFGGGGGQGAASLVGNYGGSKPTNTTPDYTGEPQAEYETEKEIREDEYGNTWVDTQPRSAGKRTSWADW